MKFPRWLQWRSRQELDEEVQAHLDLATQVEVERGLSQEEAAFAARRALGNATRLKERARAADPLFRFENIAKDVDTMKEIFEVHGLLGARLMAQIVGTMGAIGLALGVLRLYAVVAFVVTRRTREIGIRMALGATAASVLRHVLASGVKVALVGIAIGLAGAFALTRYAAEFLDRVDPHDPAAFLGVAILLLAVAMAACWAPARRASRVDPAITLRYE